jgi:hypothetical protein
VDPGSRIYEFCMVDELPVEYFSAVELTVGVISQPCYLRGAPVPKAEFTQYTCVLDGPSLPAGNVALTAFKFVNGVDEFQQVTDTTAGPKVIATVVAAGGTLSPDPCVLSVITANSDIGIATDQIEIKGTCLATARFSVTFNEYVVGPDRTAENKGVPPVHLTRQQRINNAVATAVVKVLRKDSSAIVYLPALQEPLYRNDALIVTVASPSVGGPSFPITFTVVAQPNSPFIIFRCSALPDLNCLLSLQRTCWRFVAMLTKGRQWRQQFVVDDLSCQKGRILVGRRFASCHWT